MLTRTARTIVVVVATVCLGMILFACGKNNPTPTVTSPTLIAAVTSVPSPMPTICPSPVVGELRTMPVTVALEEVALLYIDQVSAVVPVSYTWRTLLQGKIIDGQGTSAIQYRAPVTPGFYGVTVKVSGCNFYKEMSLPVAVSTPAPTIALELTLTPTPSLTPEPLPTLSCSDTRTAGLIPYEPQCPPEGAWGNVEYCQSYETFTANIDLHASKPDRSYVLSLQAADGSSQTDALLWQSCGQKTSRGDAYCDITLPSTSEQGDIQHHLSKRLEPGDYDIKLLLKDTAFDSCVAMFNDSPPSFEVVVPTLQQKGISYVTWQSGAFSTDSADAALKALSETGANWIALIVTGYQDEVSSTTIYHDALKTPSDQDLIHVIGQARELGLNVMLKPHIDLLSDSEHWRGQIGMNFSESEWQEWFISYQDFVYHYATLAENERTEKGIEIIFSIGTELVVASSRDSEWRQILEEVRDRFNGELVYASNWDEPGRDWWEELDYIGVDAYFPLWTTSDVPSVAELKDAWSPHVEMLEDLYKQYEIPLILTEIGYRSIRGAHDAPAQWQQHALVDLEEQAKLYQAALATFVGKEWLSGIYWWNWLVDPNQGGPEDTDYTPYNKPAEQVLTTCYLEGECGTIEDFCQVPLVPFTKVNSCPIDGASGEVLCGPPSDGSFQATVQLEGLEPNHTYVFSVNCWEGTNSCNLLAEACDELNGQGYCDIVLDPTDEAGNLTKEIERSLLAGEYEVKFFIKDPAADWCIPLYNDRPERFKIE